MMSRRRKLAFIPAALLSLVLLVGATRPDLYFLIKKNFTIFSEVYREVAINYVDEVEPQVLMRKGINAMLESLDPYTVFIDEADKQNIDIRNQGNYGGIGINVGIRGDKLVVISPIEGYSAARKGIQAGDVIIAVNGIDVTNRTPDEVQNLMVGEPGTSVNMTIQRIDQELTFDLQRERVEVKNVDYAGFVDPQETIAYISLNRFSQNAAAEMRQAFEDLQSKGELNGLIIDVRNNPGGLLNESVDIVDMFTDDGQMVVEMRGRQQDKNQTFKTTRPAIAASLPLVVLQNEGSASASEILAGALQDLDRAVIMGNQSFGKGLVQVIQPLSYNTALKITTARYYIPSGRSIQSVTYRHNEENTPVKKPDSLRRSFQTQNGRTVYDGQGIAPDINVDEGKPSVLETALLQQSQLFLFANQYVSEHDSYSHESLPPGVFKEFKSFLEQQDFSYETPAEQQLNKVRASLENQNISSPEVSGRLSALQKAIDTEKARALSRQSESIKKQLHLELLLRYKGQTTRDAVSLQYDPLLERSIRILKEQEEYNSILSGGG